jgi:transposase
MHLKKTLKASEQDRDDIRQSRDEWQKFKNTININKFIFLDEPGLKTNMTRLYGRSYQGKRCHDTAPCGHWESTTILSSIKFDGKNESIVFDGAVDRKMFDEYIKKVLGPTLHPGDIVVMDNLNAHKSDLAQRVVESYQAEVRFLPPYSPDLNTIEKMRSKLKQLLRGMKPRTPDELFSFVGKALDMVSASDAQGWFNSCGYIK